MKKSLWNICAGLFATLCLASAVRADVKLPAIFGDHMVLQQGSKLPVWGSAEPGEKVTVSLGGQKAEAVAGADGKWLVKLEPVKASEAALDMVVESSHASRLTFHDVLVGEVWVCSGQSNMAWPLSATFSSPEIPKANHPGIRLFKVGFKVAFEPQSDCEGQWVVCTPESVASFSGVGYFFGRELHETLRVPVGLIGSYCSGTPAQAWTSLETLRAHEPLKGYLDTIEKLRADRVRIEEDYDKKYLPAWEAEHKKWLEECRKPYDQACLRWAAEVKKAKAEGKPLPPKPELKQPEPHKYECRTRRGDNPTVLHNGMIAPLMPFAIKGVIWYQGESNCNLPILYRTLFPALISGWRKSWAQGDFPFLFVQLANSTGESSGVHLLREAQLRTLALPNTGMAVTIDIGEPKIHPRNKKDVGLRLALAARHVAYGLEFVYSGPLYKSMKIEGDKVRLTFDHVGGGLMIASAPPSRPGDIPAPPAVELKGFTIAGTDKKFMPAQAKIEQDTVVVWSDQVKLPLAVRYGWTDTPDVNLYNKEHLPASPFRTDDWK
jgi:sialate O-acetylesterase